MDKAFIAKASLVTFLSTAGLFCIALVFKNEGVAAITCGLGITLSLILGAISKDHMIGRLILRICGILTIVAVLVAGFIYIVRKNNANERLFKAHKATLEAGKNQGQPNK